MSSETPSQAAANRSDWLAPLLTIVCCFLPVAAFAPNISTRKRLGMVAAWLVLLAIGWAMSGGYAVST
jgi:hypothetical protein